MPKFIDMTPTWTQILPTWKLIVSSSTKTINRPARPSRGQTPIDGDGNMQRFWEQMQSMAAAADKWNEHCKLQRDAQEQQS